MSYKKIQEVLGLMQKNLECSICLDLLSNPVSTKCDHPFCRFCITEFLKTQRSVPCPLCKAAVTKRSLNDRPQLSEMVENVRRLMSAIYKDTGHVYSPPKGPQTMSFFPCTPEPLPKKDTRGTKRKINLSDKKESTKGRNTRNSKRRKSLNDVEETETLNGLHILGDVENCLIENDRPDHCNITCVPGNVVNNMESTAVKSQTEESDAVGNPHDMGNTGSRENTGNNREKPVTDMGIGSIQGKLLKHNRLINQSVAKYSNDADQNDKLLEYLETGSCGAIVSGSLDECKSVEDDEVMPQRKSDDVEEGKVMNLGGEKNERKRRHENLLASMESNSRGKGENDVDVEGSPENLSGSSKVSGTPREGSLSSTPAQVQVVTRTYSSAHRRAHANRGMKSSYKVKEWLQNMPLVDDHDAIDEEQVFDPVKADKQEGLVDDKKEGFAEDNMEKMRKMELEAKMTRVKACQRHTDKSRSEKVTLGTNNHDKKQLKHRIFKCTRNDLHVVTETCTTQNRGKLVFKKIIPKAVLEMNDTDVSKATKVDSVMNLLQRKRKVEDGSIMTADLSGQESDPYEFKSSQRTPKTEKHQKRKKLVQGNGGKQGQITVETQIPKHKSITKSILKQKIEKDVSASTDLQREDDVIVVNVENAAIEKDKVKKIRPLECLEIKMKTGKRTNSKKLSPKLMQLRKESEEFERIKDRIDEAEDYDLLTSTQEVQAQMVENGHESPMVDVIPDTCDDLSISEHHVRNKKTVRFSDKVVTISNINKRSTVDRVGLEEPNNKSDGTSCMDGGNNSAEISDVGNKKETNVLEMAQKKNNHKLPVVCDEGTLGTAVNRGQTDESNQGIIISDVHSNHYVKQKEQPSINCSKDESKSDVGSRNDEPSIQQIKQNHTMEKSVDKHEDLSQHSDDPGDRNTKNCKNRKAVQGENVTEDENPVGVELPKKVDKTEEKKVIHQKDRTVIKETRLQTCEHMQREILNQGDEHVKGASLYQDDGLECRGLGGQGEMLEYGDALEKGIPGYIDNKQVLDSEDECSTATEDLNVEPGEHDFEQPNLDIQPDRILEKLNSQQLVVEDDNTKMAVLTEQVTPQIEANVRDKGVCPLADTCRSGDDDIVQSTPLDENVRKVSIKLNNKGTPQKLIQDLENVKKTETFKAFPLNGICSSQSMCTTSHLSIDNSSGIIRRPRKVRQRVTLSIEKLQSESTQSGNEQSEGDSNSNLMRKTRKSRRRMAVNTEKSQSESTQSGNETTGYDTESNSMKKTRKSGEQRMKRKDNDLTLGGTVTNSDTVEVVRETQRSECSSLQDSVSILKPIVVGNKPPSIQVSPSVSSDINSTQESVSILQPTKERGRPFVGTPVGCEGVQNQSVDGAPGGVTVESSVMGQSETLQDRHLETNDQSIEQEKDICQNKPKRRCFAFESSPPINVRESHNIKGSLPTLTQDNGQKSSKASENISGNKANEMSAGNNYGNTRVDKVIMEGSASPIDQREACPLEQITERVNRAEDKKGNESGMKSNTRIEEPDRVMPNATGSRKSCDSEQEITSSQTTTEDIQQRTNKSSSFKGCKVLQPSSGEGGQHLDDICIPESELDDKVMVQSSCEDGDLVPTLLSSREVAKKEKHRVSTSCSLEDIFMMDSETPVSDQEEGEEEIELIQNQEGLMELDLPDSEILHSEDHSQKSHEEELNKKHGKHVQRQNAVALSGEHVQSQDAAALSGEHVQSQDAAALSGEHVQSQDAAALSGEHVQSQDAVALSGEHVQSQDAAALSGEHVQRQDAVALSGEHVQRQDAVALSGEHVQRQDAVALSGEHVQRQDAVALSGEHVQRQDAVALSGEHQQSQKVCTTERVDNMMSHATMEIILSAGKKSKSPIPSQLIPSERNGKSQHYKEIKVILDDCVQRITLNSKRSLIGDKLSFLCSGKNERQRSALSEIENGKYHQQTVKSGDMSARSYHGDSDDNCENEESRGVLCNVIKDQPRTSCLAQEIQLVRESAGTAADDNGDDTSAVAAAADADTTSGSGDGVDATPADDAETDNECNKISIAPSPNVKIDRRTDKQNQEYRTEHLSTVKEKQHEKYISTAYMDLPSSSPLPDVFGGSRFSSQKTPDDETLPPSVMVDEVEEREDDDDENHDAVLLRRSYNEDDNAEFIESQSSYQRKNKCLQELVKGKGSRNNNLVDEEEDDMVDDDDSESSELVLSPVKEDERMCDENDFSDKGDDNRSNESDNKLDDSTMVVRKKTQPIICEEDDDDEENIEVKENSSPGKSKCDDDDYDDGEEAKSEEESISDNDEDCQVIEEEDEEEDCVVRRKKSKTLVIEDESSGDDVSSQGSNASHQMNLTSSSAFSSQSEPMSTQHQKKMEKDLERMRREIAELEAKLSASKMSCEIESSRTQRTDRSRRDEKKKKQKKATEKNSVILDADMEDDVCSKNMNRSLLNSQSDKSDTDNIGNYETDEDSDDLFLSPPPPSPPPMDQESSIPLNCEVNLPEEIKKTEEFLQQFRKEMEDSNSNPKKYSKNCDKEKKFSDSVQSNSKMSSQSKVSVPQNSDQEYSNDIVVDSQANKITTSKLGDPVKRSPLLFISRPQRSKRKNEKEQDENKSPALDEIGVKISGLENRSVLTTVVENDVNQNRGISSLGFVATGLQYQQMRELQKLAQEHTCKVYSKFSSPEVTHVIAKTDPIGGRVCDRTLKFFQGVSHGCWILDYQWVLDSREAGRLLPEEKYEVIGDTVTAVSHGGPRKSRMCIKRDLFQNFQFVINGFSKGLRPDDLKDLLTSCGGSVVVDPEEFSTYKTPMIVTCSDVDDNEDAGPPSQDLKSFNKYYRQYGALTVSREWVLDSLTLYKVQQLQDYVLTCVKGMVIKDIKE